MFVSFCYLCYLYSIEYIERVCKLYVVICLAVTFLQFAVDLKVVAKECTSVHPTYALAMGVSAFSARHD